MGAPEMTVLAVPILLGVCFQVGLWRDWCRTKYRKDFHIFFLAFYGAIQTLVVDAGLADRSGSHLWSVVIAILTALACLAIAFGIAQVWPERN